MSVAENLRDEPDRLSAAINDALTRASGDAPKAAAYLKQRVQSDARLKTALLDPLIEYACHQAVGQVLRTARDRVWNAPARSPNNDAARVAALAADNLLLFPLPGGKPLGEATREDIAQAQDFYTKQATDMAHKAQWLGLVSQSLVGGKTVKQVMSAERLRELQEEARNV